MPLALYQSKLLNVRVEWVCWMVQVHHARSEAQWRASGVQVARWPPPVCKVGHRLSSRMGVKDNQCLSHIQWGVGPENALYRRFGGDKEFLFDSEEQINKWTKPSVQTIILQVLCYRLFAQYMSAKKECLVELFSQYKLMIKHRIW